MCCGRVCVFSAGIRKMQGVFPGLALPGRVFPSESPNSAYLPFSNNFLVCKSFHRSYFFIVFPTMSNPGQFLDIILQKFSIMSPKGCDLLPGQIIKLPPILFSLFWGGGDPFPLTASWLTLLCVMQRSGFSGDSSTFGSDGSRFCFRA